MKYLNSIFIGAFVGIIYGAILWFVRSELIHIYATPRAAFKIVYDPSWFAFVAALTCAILSLAVILTYPYWIGFFEGLAMKIAERQRVEGDDNE